MDSNMISKKTTFRADIPKEPTVKALQEQITALQTELSAYKKKTDTSLATLTKSTILTK